MKRITFYVVCMLAMATAAAAQEKMTFTGTALIYGSRMNTRTISEPFKMIVTGETSQADAARYLSVLKSEGQDKLLDAIDSNDLGSFSLGNSVGHDLLAVIVDKDGGDTRIRAVFQRWLGFGELRRGLRSVDYPFGYVEIRVDPKTGKGMGTFIPAAKIKFNNSGENGRDTVVIEDFGTFPGRLMAVSMSGRREG
ncbi:MAG: hypothetical protein IT173_11780 [Acidobacteria bacterium]|nr:hypothetical protein [Acidobacteriota bacterium]